MTEVEKALLVLLHDLWQEWDGGLTVALDTINLDILLNQLWELEVQQNFVLIHFLLLRLVPVNVDKGQEVQPAVPLCGLQGLVLSILFFSF